MERPMPPCKDCKERKPGCSSRCYKYLRFKVALGRYNDEVKLERAFDNMTIRRCYINSGRPKNYIAFHKDIDWRG